MRSFLIFSMLLLLITPLPSQAQHRHDHPYSPIPKIADVEETRPGYYGFRHRELHIEGVIKELMEATGSNCCDGGEGGECRVAEIRPDGNGGMEALLDGEWCPITIQIQRGVKLLGDNSSVVCASKYKGKTKTGKMCPSTYCAAAAHVPGT